MWTSSVLLQMKASRLARCKWDIVALLSIICLFTSHQPVEAKLTDGQSFDFVIVGGGSAGCVVANRLSEVGNWSVLLVEAGGDPPVLSKSPGLSALLGISFPDWNYYTLDDGRTAQAHITNNIHEIKGKMLGGSSSCNYMYYVRGNKVDYDQWVSLGNPGWDWDTVTEYFKKSEGLMDSVILNSASGPLHNTNGNILVTRPVYDTTRELFNAFEENGHDILVDTNGYQQLGYSPPSFTIGNDTRQSTVVSYLRPVEDRPNLFIAKNSFVRKIIFDNNNSAIGVEVKTQTGKVIQVFASREVILSAGSIASPQILMLSGVGPKENLEKHNINIVHDSPNVGRNLQNHMLVPVVLTGKKDLLSFIKTITDPITYINTFPSPNILGFVALDKNQTYPDYQVTALPLPRGSLISKLFCLLVFKFEERVCFPMLEAALRGQSIFALVTLLHPSSRGQIRLQSTNPEDLPIIESGFYSNVTDLEKFARCVQDYTSVVNTTYFRSVKSEVVDLNVEGCEEFDFGSIEYWKCYVLNMVATQFHAVGTCAMGPNGVVDERLRVRGVKMLRVVDASVMPTITSGNTYMPVVMIAEKASDMIKVDNGIGNEK